MYDDEPWICVICARVTRLKRLYKAVCPGGLWWRLWVLHTATWNMVCLALGYCFATTPHL
jgi:hypothetical protein